jgi:hypothetical protein
MRYTMHTVVRYITGTQEPGLGLDQHTRLAGRWNHRPLAGVPGRKLKRKGGTGERVSSTGWYYSEGGG